VAENSKPQCQICHKATPPNAGMPAELLRPSLFEFIQKRVPNFDPKSFICLNDLGQFRRDYVKEVLEDEIGELTALDQEVVDSLQQHEILSENIGKEFDQELTFGEHLSDRIASFGGSWTFIIMFGVVLLVWIVINTIVLATRAFDPYPFILMNPILSCLAALQAPVIMMSQNRTEARDRPGRKRLQGEPESQIGNPALARETRSPVAQAIQPALRDPADPDRAAGGSGAKTARRRGASHAGCRERHARLCSLTDDQFYLRDLRDAVCRDGDAAGGVRDLPGCPAIRPALRSTVDNPRSTARLASQRLARV
jgi:hypothetical protein